MQAWGQGKATKTGISALSAAEQETVRRLGDKAARLSTDRLLALKDKYQAAGRWDIVDALLTELHSR